MTMSLDSIVGDIDVTKLSSILSLTALNELGMPLAGNTTNQFSHDTCPKAYDRVMIGWSQPVTTKDCARNMPPRRRARSGDKWARSEKNSRFVSDPSYGTRRSSVRSSAGCRLGTIQRARCGRCIASNRAGIGLGVRAGYVPQVGELAAASPNRRMMASCARGRSLERLRCAGQRQSSLG